MSKSKLATCFFFVAYAVDSIDGPALIHVQMINDGHLYWTAGELTAMYLSNSHSFTHRKKSKKILQSAGKRLE